MTTGDLEIHKGYKGLGVSAYCLHCTVEGFWAQCLGFGLARCMLRISAIRFLGVVLRCRSFGGTTEE